MLCMRATTAHTRPPLQRQHAPNRVNPVWPGYDVTYDKKALSEGFFIIGPLMGL